MRRDILSAAREIVAAEGIEGVSVRKIAGKIEYSPAIIYHYFSSKEEIVENLIAESYAKIIRALTALKSMEMAPAEKLRMSAERFISLAVEMGDSYKSMMINSSPAVLARTSVLQQGASAERPAIRMLCDALRELPSFSNRSDEETELTAQIVWSTAFGISLRLIVEQVDENQKQRLIHYAADFVLKSLQ